MAPQTPTSSSVGNSGLNSAQLVEQLNYLNQEIARLQAIQKGKSYKMDKPGPYDGTKGTLQGFLTHSRAYFKHNVDQFTKDEEKILFPGTRLEGDAAKWFEPTLRDYLENNYKE